MVPDPLSTAGIGRAAAIVPDASHPFRMPKSGEPVQFVAPDYSRWSVHEVHDPSTPTGRALLFVSTTGFRRVRSYPADWRTLTAAALWELSWGK